MIIPKEIKDKIVNTVVETVDKGLAYGIMLCQDRSGNISMGYANIDKHEFRCPSNTKPVASILMYPE